MTVLDLYCKFKGYQGGTIHQAQRDYVNMDLFEQRKFVNLLKENMDQIVDFQTAEFFISLHNIRVL